MSLIQSLITNCSNNILKKRIENLEEVNYAKEIFEIISGTAGAITTYPNLAISQDKWAIENNAIAVEIDAGRPTSKALRTTAGKIIEAIVDPDGIYTLNGTPTASDYCLIWQIKGTAKDFGIADIPANKLINEYDEITLADFPDVVITSAAENDFIQFKSDKWVNRTLAQVKENFSEYALKASPSFTGDITLTGNLIASGKITSDTADIIILDTTTLNAITLNATTVDAPTVDAITVNATTLNATTVDAPTVNATTLNAPTANITTLNATAIDAPTADITTVDATTVNAATVDATTVDATTLTATNATFTGNYVKVDNKLRVGANYDNAFITVSGFVNKTTSGKMSGWGYDTWQNIVPDAVDSGDISIWCNYGIMSGANIFSSRAYIYSDERIKNIIGISDSKKDIEILKKLEVTDYTKKDVYKFGNNEEKKLIAQQIEKHFPQAVSENVDFIPNIYKKAQSYEILENGTLKVNVEYGDLVVGDTVKMIFEEFNKDKKKINEKEIQVKVLKAHKNSFDVEYLEDFESTETDSAITLFVYGKKVSDFKSIDYEAVFMLNVSATQEIIKQLELIKKENIKLKERIKKIEKMEKK